MQEKDILDSWKEICAYLKRSEKTCRKWEHELGLPIHRIEDSPKARVFAYREELDRWMAETQHSEKQGPFGNVRMRRLFVAIATIIILAITAVLIWRPWSEKAATPISSAKPSIAILPFVDLSPEKDQEYFCDGMTDELINRLTKIENLRVPARTSAFSFKGKILDINDIGEKLDVENVLEGSVRKAGGKLRITVQMVKVEDGSSIWSEKYDREMEDIFALQDEIALAIVDKLKLKLMSENRAKIMKRYTENSEAYNLYLKGQYFREKRTKEPIKKAIEYYESALEKDPDYALAYVGLSTCYSDLGWYGYKPPMDVYPKAKVALKKALELEYTLVEAHRALGAISLFYDWDWPSAEKHLQQAIELNPSYANSHHINAEYLRIMGRFDEAIGEMKRALELDPLSIMKHAVFGEILRYTGRWDEAIQQHLETIEMDSNYVPTQWMIGVAYQSKEMNKEALAAYQKAIKFSGGFPHATGWLGVAYAKSGQREKAVNLRLELEERSKREYIPKTSIAFIYASLGEIDKAFELLEKAYQERDQFLIYNFKRVPDLESIHSDLRYKKLRKKMNLN